MKKICQPIVVLFLVALASCARIEQASTQSNANRSSDVRRPAPRNTSRVIHVLVALCDNRYQGIVPVPERIGNGDDPASNLYWGAGFGVKTFFKRAGEWKLLLDQQNPAPAVLERLVFKRKDADVYLVADAYRGREIKRCTADFLSFAAGRDAQKVENIPIHAGGSADLLAYVGHDGLMDFSLDEIPQRSDDRRRDAVILACISKRYFAEPLRQTGARPIVWTTGLMAPEAYVLKAAIDGWILREDGERIRRRAAEAYNTYQRCGLKAAMNLFSTGW
ncbi:MAG: hypothetical protein AB1631_18010 [Acidobacteriota bacterium]